MTGGELLALLRQELNDEETPPLWSDAQLYAYIDDAQKMFCRKTDGISDASTASVVRVPFAVGADWVRLHKSILYIRSAHLLSDGRAVELINQDDMDGKGVRFDGKTGPVRRLVIGMEQHKARVYPVASIADTLVLTVFRLPLNTIALVDDDFEIDEQHHQHLMLWAKHRAFSKHDSETYNKNSAEDNEAAFMRYCADVMTEQRNKRRKVRVVGYGGIPFSC